MKTYVNTLAAAALALAAAAPAFANSQLIANAGLSQAEAEGLTLEQIAAAKFNRNVSFSDRQAVVIEAGSADHSQLAASVGLGADASLNEVVATKFNAHESFSDRQAVRGAGVTVATRSGAADTAAWAQLIASAGLSADEAEGMTLSQIAAAKDNRHLSYSDRQQVN